MAESLRAGVRRLIQKVSLLLLNWAKGGAITSFFQTIFDKVVGMFS